MAAGGRRPFQVCSLLQGEVGARALDHFGASVSLILASARRGFSTYGLTLPVSLSGAFLLIVAICCAFPEVVATHDPYAANFAALLQPPSKAHLFGTDALGRDAFSRVVYGAAFSLQIGTGSILLALAFAIPLGVAAGISRRWLDNVIVRVLDVIGAFPELLLAILVIALIGPGVANLIFAMGFASIPKLARVVRVRTKVVVNSGYVEHVRTLGQPKWQILLRHVLPNAVGVLPIVSIIGLGHTILGAAGLSFLGLGPRPPAPEWGLMLSEALSKLRVAWWLGFFPGSMITLVVVSLTVISRHLQASFEQRETR